MDTPNALSVASRHLHRASPSLVGNNGRPDGNGNTNSSCNNSNCATPALFGQSCRHSLPRHKQDQDLVHPTVRGSAFVTGNFNETARETTLISRCPAKAAAASISLIMKNVASTKKLPQSTGAPGGNWTPHLLTVSSATSTSNGAHCLDTPKHLKTESAALRKAASPTGGPPTRACLLPWRGGS